MSAFPFLESRGEDAHDVIQKRDRSRSRERDSDRSYARDGGRDRDRDRDMRYDDRSRDRDYRSGPSDRDRERDRGGDRDRDRDYRGQGGQSDRDRHQRHQDNSSSSRGNDRNFRMPQQQRNLPLAPAPAKPQPVDENLAPIEDDPRIVDGRKMAKTRGGGRNTESFDPRSTLIRPDMRIIVGPNKPVYGKALKHDDVVIVPEFLCKEEDWELYYTLVEEMRAAQAEAGIKGAEWISWAEGSHLISKNPNGSKTYGLIQEKIAAYFEIERKSVGTRFNWYRDSTDWKPFHHDSAAFNPSRARNQNITVGISLGASRELAFLHAKTGERLYFPQTNGMLFSFGRDVNIHYKHGINALAEEEQDGKGRISIILWGLAPHCTEEQNSPRILDDNTRGGGHSIHATSGNNRGAGGGGRDVCHDFRKGSCTRGDSCRFSHQQQHQ